MTQTPIRPGRFSYNTGQIDVVPLGSFTSAGQTSSPISINSRSFLLVTQVIGAGSTVQVGLEGSLDGTNFFTLGSEAVYSTEGFFAIRFTEFPVAFVRARITNITAGTPTITFTLSSY